MTFQLQISTVREGLSPFGATIAASDAGVWFRFGTAPGQERHHHFDVAMLGLSNGLAELPGMSIESFTIRNVLQHRHGRCTCRRASACPAAI